MAWCDLSRLIRPLTQSQKDYSSISPVQGASYVLGSHIVNIHWYGRTMAVVSKADLSDLVAAAFMVVIIKLIVNSKKARYIRS